MPRENKIASVLVILIMLVELVILFRAMMINTWLGLLVWAGTYFLDKFIAKVHDEYFSDSPRSGRRR